MNTYSYKQIAERSTINAIFSQHPSRGNHIQPVDTGEGRVLLAVFPGGYDLWVAYGGLLRKPADNPAELTVTRHYAHEHGQPYERLACQTTAIALAANEECLLAEETAIPEQRSAEIRLAKDSLYMLGRATAQHDPRLNQESRQHLLSMFAAGHVFTPWQIAQTALSALKG